MPETTLGELAKDLEALTQRVDHVQRETTSMRAQLDSRLESMGTRLGHLETSLNVLDKLNRLVEAQGRDNGIKLDIVISSLTAQAKVISRISAKKHKRGRK